MGLGTARISITKTLYEDSMDRVYVYVIILRVDLEVKPEDGGRRGRCLWAEVSHDCRVSDYPDLTIVFLNLLGLMFFQ